MKFLIASLGMALCTAAAGQGMYKCKDAAGKITYSGSECHLIGLTSAGEVTGRASVTPALKPPAAAAAPPARPLTPPGPASAKAPEPAEKRCFTVTKVVKSAKGNTTVTSTRCNDEPEEEAESK